MLRQSQDVSKGGVTLCQIIVMAFSQRKFGRRIILPSLQEKERKVLKLLCLQEKQKGEYIFLFVLYSFQRKTKVSCYKYLHCREKKKVSNYIFTRKTKVSYNITFFQTLLKTFSSGLCYSDRRIILTYCEKRKGNYDVCKKNKRVSSL